MSNGKEVNVIVDAQNKSKGAFIEVKRDLNEIGSTAKKNFGDMGNSIAKSDKLLRSFGN